MLQFANKRYDFKTGIEFEKYMLLTLHGSARRVQLCYREFYGSLLNKGKLSTS